MSNRHVVNVLAIAGALIVLLGVMVAANSAFADEMAAVRTTAVAIHTAGDDSRDTAAEAHREAASAAIENLAAGTRLDLDMRLIGRTSSRVATLR